jgi:hypothetical protein
MCVYQCNMKVAVGVYISHLAPVFDPTRFPYKTTNTSSSTHP